MDTLIVCGTFLTITVLIVRAWSYHIRRSCERDERIHAQMAADGYEQQYGQWKKIKGE